MNEGANTWIPMLREVMVMWRRYDEVRPIRSANALMFWRDGMLSPLQTIADGRGSPEVYSALKKEFESSREGVSVAMKSLRAARSQVLNTSIAHQIDRIMSAAEYGKRSIRSDIESIVYQPDGQDNVKVAQRICSSIEILNNEIGKLQRMIDGL